MDRSLAVTEPVEVTHLKLGTVGMDERARQSFRLFLLGPGEGRAVLVDDPDQAEAWLIDLDSLEGERMYADRQTTHPGVPCIVIALGQQPVDVDTLFVQKPAQSENMLSAIDRTRLLLCTRSIAGVWPIGAPTATPRAVVEPAPPARPAPKITRRQDERAFANVLSQREDIDPGDPARVAVLHYDPYRYLQGYCRWVCALAMAEGRPLRVLTPWLPLTILPRQHKVWIGANDTQLRAACAIQFDFFAQKSPADVDLASQIECEFSDEEAERLARRAGATTLEAFLWKVALATSKGRIPEEIDLNRPVRLTRWPNFTRVPITPHALRIAALLHRQPHTLFEAARVLDVRQSFVAVFLNAAWTAGLLELLDVGPVAPAEKAPPTEPVVERSEMSTPLKRLLRRLRLI
jgi:hypothetical protein